MQDRTAQELWSFRSQDHSLPGGKVPGVELSLPGTFAPWNFRSTGLSLPGTFAPWDFRSFELLLPPMNVARSDSSTNMYRPTCM